MEVFCERCGCDDPKYFVYFNDAYQCRRCIAYQGEEGESLSFDKDVIDQFDFNLTNTQKRVSHQIYEASLKGNVLVRAVCGAGKSELIVETMSHFLSQHKKVGIAIARRQVVLELAQRYQAIYPHLKVTPICEGYTKDLSGQLIISTAHQLYRFHKQFDCLIIDEPDAFPYSNDPVLQGFAQQACKGVRIYLTATPDDKVERITQERIQLFKRPHGYPLPVPQVHRFNRVIQILWLRQYLNKQDKPTLIFVPSIKLGKRISLLLKIPFVYASDKDLDQKIKQFKEGLSKYLVCTTVLERGVTFSNVQVLIVEANHPVFNLASLIQIAGRVGRKFNYPEGEVIFLCSKLTQTIKTCITDLQKANNA